MRIYRFLAPPEYECFLNKKSLLDLNSTWGVFQAECMLFPQFLDRYGKFFFFELEDAFQFARYYDNCSKNDMILELDIEPENALKFLSVAPYEYPDPPRKKHGFAEHQIPELFVDHEYIDEKIENGDYRVINPTSELKGFPRHIYDSNRTPGLVELGNILNKIIPLKKDLSMFYFLLSEHLRELKELGIEVSSDISPEQATSIINQLNEIAKAKFFDFVREHEKYMALIPAGERQPG